MERSHYRWLILFVAWMSYLTVYLTRLSVGPLAPFLKEALALSNLQIGSLVSASAVMYAPTLVASGWLVDRFGVRWVLVFGTLMTGLCLTLLFAARSYSTMFFILLFSGLGTGCILPSGVKAVVLWFPMKERATALGINQTAVNVGGIVGATVLPTVALTLGWEYGFLFCGFGTILISICSSIIYRNPVSKSQLSRATELISHGYMREVSVPRLVFTLLRSRDIWMVIIAAFFICIVEFATMANLVLYLSENLLLGAVMAGGLLAITELAGALGKPISGLISDRLLGGRRKIPFLVMGALSGVMCLVLAAGKISSGWVLYPVLIILGLTAIGWAGLYMALISELAGKEAAGTSVGLATGVVAVGVMVGPPLFGYVVDLTGSFQAAWLVMALSGFASAAFMFMVREHKRHI